MPSEKMEILKRVGWRGAVGLGLASLLLTACTTDLPVLSGEGSQSGSGREPAADGFRCRPFSVYGGDEATLLYEGPYSNVPVDLQPKKAGMQGLKPNERALATGWTQVLRHIPGGDGRYPFVVVRVEKNGVEGWTDIENLYSHPKQKNNEPQPQLSEAYIKVHRATCEIEDRGLGLPRG